MCLCVPVCLPLRAGICIEPVQLEQAQRKSQQPQQLLPSVEGECGFFPEFASMLSPYLLVRAVKEGQLSNKVSEMSSQGKSHPACACACLLREVTRGGVV